MFGAKKQDLLNIAKPIGLTYLDCSESLCIGVSTLHTRINEFRPDICYWFRSQEIRPLLQNHRCPAHRHVRCKEAGSSEFTVSRSPLAKPIGLTYLDCSESLCIGVSTLHTRMFRSQEIRPLLQNHRCPAHRHVRCKEAGSSEYLDGTR
jgi:hypothetical protein